MRRNMKQMVRDIIGSPRRRAVPVLTSPGIEWIGAKPREVFQNGALQFQCIEALAAETPSDILVTFMDLSVEAEAFGAPVCYSDHENPTISGKIVSSAEEIAALPVPEIGAGRTGEVLRCAELCSQRLDRPVLGGMIGPFSLAGRLADMTEMMILAAAEPETAMALLEKSSEFLGKYALALRDVGVNGIFIAEPAAGLLSPEMCAQFSAVYLQRIVAAVQDDEFMVVLHNCGNAAGAQIPELLSVGAAALHLGNATDLVKAGALIPRDVLLMGNVDPVGVLKEGSPEMVYTRTSELLREMADYPNYVLSTGCDVPPGVSRANIQAFFRALEDYNQSV